MKKSLPRRRSSYLVTAALCLASTAFALTESEWRYRQTFALESAGATRIAVPLESLDHAQPDLRDLRVVGSNGQEIPFAFVRPADTRARWGERLPVTLSLRDDATVILVDAKQTRAWEAIDLVVPAPWYLKSARLEASSDNQTWELWGTGIPLFRRDGVDQSTIELAKKPARYFRITLDDRQEKRIVVTHARLREPAVEAKAIEPIEIKVTHTEQYAFSTVLTLALPAANVDLEWLELIAPEGLFNRPVHVSLREFEGAEVRENTLGEGRIFRLRLNNELTSEHTRIALPVTAPSRELLLYVENGDSPPLRIERVTGARRIVYLAFEAPGPGKYEIWTGNPEAPAAHYDVASMADPLRQIALTATTFERFSENPHYRRADPLAGIAFEGSGLKLSDWSNRREVKVAGAGVHLLELDLAALAAAQPSLSDVRLVRDDKQVPYILERTSFSRSLDLSIETAPDPKAVNVSRWRVTLPRSGAPITMLSFATSASLFERTFRVFERRRSGTGDGYEVELAREQWKKVPGEVQDSITFPIEKPDTAELWIETDNGDNPAIPLTRVRAFYPVRRLLFRTQAEEELTLLCGNPQAAPPRYDLGLVAPVLLRSEKTPATLNAAESVASTSSPGHVKSLLFWSALALVVIALLVVVAKLLPKPPS